MSHWRLSHQINYLFYRCAQIQERLVRCFEAQSLQQHLIMMMGWRVGKHGSNIIRKQQKRQSGCKQFVDLRCSGTKEGLGHCRRREENPCDLQHAVRIHLGRASALFGGEKTRSGRNASPFRLATSATEREEPELHHPSYNFTNLPTAAKTHVHTPSFILLPLHCRGILDTLLFAHRTIGFKAPGSRPAPSSLGL